MKRQEKAERDDRSGRRTGEKQRNRRQNIQTNWREGHTRSTLVVAAIGMGMLGVLLTASAPPLYKKLRGGRIPMSDTPLYAAGVYEVSERGYGGLVTVKAEFTPYGIENVWVDAPDETPEVGQAAAVKLAKAFWEKQTDEVDAVSGATVTSEAVKRGMTGCMREAALEGTQLAARLDTHLSEEGSNLPSGGSNSGRSDETGVSSSDQNRTEPSLEELLKKTPDGTYSYVCAEPDDSGQYNAVKLTVKDHRLTALSWDSLDDAGVGKRALSAEGKYNMTADGPKWYQQADSLAGYLIEYQTDEGLLDENGYAQDAISSVSIYAGGFLDTVKRCLMAVDGYANP